MFGLGADARRSWFVKIVFFIVLIVFALFGVYGYLGSSGLDNQTEVAKIGSKVITAADFSRALAQTRSQINDPRELLDRMINTILIKDFANDIGLASSEQEVYRQLSRNEEFFTDSRFDKRKYASFLQANGLQAQQFENQISEQITQSTIENIITSFAAPNKANVTELFDAINQITKVKLVKISNSDFYNKINASNENLQAFYTQETKRYSTGQEYDIAYYNVSALEAYDKIHGTAPDNDALQDYYDKNKDKFTEQAGFHTEHILISTKNLMTGKDIRTDEQAQKLANDIYLKVKANPSDLTKLAKEYSNDPSVIRNNGDLGFQPYGQFEPNFEDAVKAMSPGQISRPVQTNYGYHIIKLIALRPSRVKAFAEVKDEVLFSYKLAQAQTDIKNIYDKYNSSFNKAAYDELKGTYSSTAKDAIFLSANNSTGYNGDALALYNKLLEYKEPGFGLLLQDRKLVAFEIKKTTAPHLLAYDEVKASVARDYKDFTAVKLLNEAVSQYLNRPISKSEFADLVKKVNLPVKEIEVSGVKPEIPGIGVLPNLQSEILSMNSKKEALIVPDQSNSEVKQVFYAVEYISKTKGKKATEQELQAVSQDLQQLLNNYYYSIIINSKRQKTSITINEPLLLRLSQGG